MKKFILLAALAISAAIFQPAKAQVSFNLSVGPQPRYVPVRYSYAPPVYYAPTRRYVSVRNHRYTNNRSIIVNHHNYAGPSRRYESKHYNRPAKHHMVKNHGRGHGRRH